MTVRWFWNGKWSVLAENVSARQAEAIIAKGKKIFPHKAFRAF